MQFGIADLFLGDAAIHAVHGHGWKALASIGVRSGGAAIGAGIGSLAGKSCNKPDNASRSDDSCWEGVNLLAGALIGFLSGIVIDVVVIAREDVEPAKPPRAPASAFTLAPSVAALPGGGFVGAGGTW